MTPLQQTLVGVHAKDLAGFMGESLAMIEACLLEMTRRGQIAPKAAFRLPVNVPTGMPKPQFEYIFRPVAA